MSDTGPVDTPAPDAPILIRVLPPFDVAYPGVYEVTKSPDTGEWQIGQEVTPAPDPVIAAPDAAEPVAGPATIVVRVLPPFDFSYPDTYEVEEISETGAWKVAGGVDFDPSYLEQVN